MTGTVLLDTIRTIPLQISDGVYLLGLAGIALLLYLLFLGLALVTVVGPAAMWLIRQYQIYNITRGVRDIGAGIHMWGGSRWAEPEGVPPRSRVGSEYEVTDSSEETDDSELES